MAAKKKTAKKTTAKKTPAKKTTAKKSAAKAPKIVIGWWEIQSQQPDKLMAFYSAAFDWKIDANNPMHYGMVASGGRGGIEGGIGGSQMPGSRVLVYAGVSKINPVLAKIEKLGGKTVMPRTDVGPVIIAIYTDPEGNIMGLMEV